jgi:hypothetical protein
MAITITRNGRAGGLTAAAGRLARACGPRLRARPMMPRGRVPGVCPA